MINILIPLAGKETFETSENHLFPMLLSDLDGRMLIERAVAPFLELEEEVRIIVVAPQKYVSEYHLDNILNLLDSRICVLGISDFTQGAVSSALLAIEKLVLEEPIIISSFEQVLDLDINNIVNTFITNEVDAGVIVFESMHPKWSYVMIEGSNVIETSEKKPISKNAIAGFYYFNTAGNFIECAKNIIRKDVRINGRFYISSVLNEVILQNGLVMPIHIENDKYFYIKDAAGLSRFNQSIIEGKATKTGMLLNKTQYYSELFDSKDLSGIATLLTDDFKLTDNIINTNDKDETLDYLADIFSNNPGLKFQPRKIYAADSMTTMIEFVLNIDGKEFVGIDILKWNDSAQLKSMQAYLYEAQI